MCKFEVNIFKVRFSNDFSLPLTSFEIIRPSFFYFLIYEKLFKMLESGGRNKNKNKNSKIEESKKKKKK